MKNAKLTALTIERFKSFEQPTRIELAPLTIILGRNNSGKSSIIQSLLLLKQTLNDPRSDVMLKLDGIVDAFNLWELTYGWPDASEKVEGPTITLEWEYELKSATFQNLEIAYSLFNRDIPNNQHKTPPSKIIKTSILLRTAEINNDTLISGITIKFLNTELTDINIKFDLQVIDGKKTWTCDWNGKNTSLIDFDFDHFIPSFNFDLFELKKDNSESSFNKIYRIILQGSLKELKRLLSEFHYLGSSRQPPPNLFKLATTTPSEIGVNGEWAAQLLQRRKNDYVHFLPPLQVFDGDETTIPNKVCSLPLVGAVNRVMSDLSITTPLKVKEIEQVGFQLMFGDASLVHVGRGLNSLLPMVELGLFADPLRFTGDCGDMDLAEYQDKCTAYSHIALEEPEAHLHPKVASRLAHWLVSLAMANRRLLVETHSDHLVRRLRGLAARAGSGSELERWLLENVVVLSVEQDEDGRSTVTSSRLTAEGGVEEKWPADFMDEATDEESAIYYAKLDKSEKAESRSLSDPVFEVIEGEEPELDEAP